MNISKGSICFSTGTGQSPFIIAEMSGNHNGSLERALELVDCAAKAGAHALKIQTYTADTMTLDIKDREFMINDKSSIWNGKSLYELYQQASTPWEWHKAIFDRCESHGMVGFSSPFDPTAVDFLEELQVPLYKIASFEITDIPLVKKVAATGKPVILSTGMASVSEISTAVRTLEKYGSGEFALLKCTSAYPAQPKDINLATIPHMKELFGCEVGLSDHTLGLGVPIASVAFGASIIEKHFTLDRNDGGVDSTFSLEPHELSSLVEQTRVAYEAVGVVTYSASSTEELSVTHRRSIYVCKDVMKGELITEDNIRTIRPGLGLAPKHWDTVIGMKAMEDIDFGTPLDWTLIS